MTGRYESQRKRHYPVIVKRSFSDLPPGHDWEALASDFAAGWRLTIFPGHTALESVRTQLDPSGSTTRYDGKGERADARNAWWRRVDRLLANS